MKLLNLLVALYVTGCGAADDKADQKLAPSQPPSQSPVSTDVTYQNQSKAETALAVADQTALPTCDKASEGQLAYTRAEKTFHVCGDGSWSEIDLRGPQGPQGEKGDAGQVTEAAPAKAPELAPNEFIEQGSGLIWLKGLTAVVFTDAKAICDAVGRRMPTEKEIQKGYILGTLKGIGSTAAWIWTDAGREVRGDGVAIDTAPLDKGFAFCVKD